MERGQPGLMRWIFLWIIPLVQDQWLNLLTSSPTRYHWATDAPRFVANTYDDQCRVHGRMVNVLDLRSRGLIPTALVMCKSLGQALNPHCLCQPNSNGYQVERKLILCEWLQLQKLLCTLPRKMRLWKSELQYLGVINVKSAEPTLGYVDNKHAPLPISINRWKQL